MGNLAVSSIMFYPADPSIVFAGTGEGFFNADSIRGAGVFMSTNVGESWSQLPSTATTDFDFVNRLAFSNDGSVLLAATRTGIFRSLNLGASWSMVHPRRRVPGRHGQQSRRTCGFALSAQRRLRLARRDERTDLEERRRRHHVFQSQ
jgi:photosystem II stability/assembly factor-like uncharacterized protein